MNEFIKKCEQCDEYKNIKDVKFFPAERETYSDGTIQTSWDRYYCEDCMSTWGDCHEGLSYEEWSATQPITVELVN